MFVHFSYFWQFFSSYERFTATQQVFGHMKPGRTHWSKSPRDPCTLEGVAGAQSFFPAGVDNKTISLVSMREAFVCIWYLVRTS